MAKEQFGKITVTSLNTMTSLNTFTSYLRWRFVCDASFDFSLRRHHFCRHRFCRFRLRWYRQIRCARCRRSSGSPISNLRESLRLKYGLGKKFKIAKFENYEVRKLRSHKITKFENYEVRKLRSSYNFFVTKFEIVSKVLLKVPYTTLLRTFHLKINSKFYFVPLNFVNTYFKVCNFKFCQLTL